MMDIGDEEKFSGLIFHFTSVRAASNSHNKRRRATRQKITTIGHLQFLEMHVYYDIMKFFTRLLL